MSGSPRSSSTTSVGPRSGSRVRRRPGRGGRRRSPPARARGRAGTRSTRRPPPGAPAPLWRRHVERATFTGSWGAPPRPLGWRPPTVGGAETPFGAQPSRAARRWSSCRRAERVRAERPEHCLELWRQRLLEATGVPSRRGAGTRAGSRAGTVDRAPPTRPAAARRRPRRRRRDGRSRPGAPGSGGCGPSRGRTRGA